MRGLRVDESRSPIAFCLADRTSYNNDESRTNAVFGVLAMG